LVVVINNATRSRTDRRQWRRDRLASTYEQFLAAQEALTGLIGRPAIKGSPAAVAKAWTDLATAKAKLELAAPKEVLEAAQELHTATMSFQIAMEVIPSLVTRFKDGTNTPQDSETLEKLQGWLGNYKPVRDALVDRIRADLDKA
jgi:hypothetical protein